MPLGTNSKKIFNSAIFTSNRWYRATDIYEFYLKWHLKKIRNLELLPATLNSDFAPHLGVNMAGALLLHVFDCTKA